MHQCQITLLFQGAGYPNAAYPVGAFQYPPPTGAPIDGKMRGNKGFENAAYQTAPGGGIHTRQFSQATTASQNGKRSPAGSSSETSPNAGAAASPPAGVGETTYQEWYQKVCIYFNDADYGRMILGRQQSCIATTS